MKREQTLDIVKGISILGIILVHFPAEYRLFSLGISFHVAAFFAVTGILMGMKSGYDTDNISASICKDIKRLLYPYVVLSLIYIITHAAVKIITSGVSSLPAFLNESIFQTVSFLGIGTLWFLPVMFLAKIIYRLITKLFKRYRHIIMLLLGMFGCISSFLLYQNKVIQIAYAASIVGFIDNLIIFILEVMIAVAVLAFGELTWKVIKIIKIDKKPILSLTISVVFMTINILVFNVFSGNDMHYAKMINIYGYYLCAFLGIISILCLSITLSRVSIISKIISFFGTNSLIIMTTHLEYHVITAVLLVCTMFFNNNILIKLVGFIGVCIIEVIICFIVQKTPLQGIYTYEKSFFCRNRNNL